jgi:predicted Ser/Thr protein kinase
MACIGNNTLVALADDRSPHRLRELDAHLDTCPDCRQLVAALVEMSWMRGSRAPTLPAVAAPAAPTGVVIDRYIVIELLGVGGMGAVYAAYDPRLDRKIALKVLRPDGPGADDRLLDEAKTLARLGHPNVVAVYDAGVVAGQVYIAMELVDGTTLRRWLADPPRTWREIVRVFVDAAAGLAAAHAAGVVHRDFKPENVLIGRDGRVRVADFGLARAGERPSIASITGDSGEVTAIAGTPAYMAPEQRRGAVSARADQYSFCVALHEALFGYRPGAPATATATRPPKAVVATIARGLAVDPADRHPSMDALIAALRARSRARIAAVATAAAACIAAGAFGLLRDAHAEPPACTADLAGTWDPPAREALAARFVATGRADAARTFAAVASQIDRYADAWIVERSASCEASARGEQSAERLDQRMGCLDLRREELATRLAALREVSTHNLDDVPGVLASLVDPKSCGSRAALARESTPPPAGTVSDFDDGTLASRFGQGWSVSTDTIMGGRSAAELAVVDGGFVSAKALAIRGTVDQGRSAIAWAGAMFYPGRAPMAPVDLSAHHAIAFAARGEPGTYELLVFSQSKGDLPAFRPFDVGREWREYHFALADFDGVNPGDIKGLLVAYNRPGRFELIIDHVRFE